MPGRGVHFAVSDPELKQLLAARDDEAVMDLIEKIEERWDKSWLIETDSAWWAIHLALTANGAPAGLERVVLGGRPLYKGDDYHVVVVGAKDVPEVADALGQLDEASFRRLYDRLDRKAYGRPRSAEDFAYTWESFVPLQEFWRRAADARRNVVFTVDG
jgi:hypothetical protein